MGRHEEPGKIRAGILAVLVHLLFIGFLIFGVDWQSEEPAAVQADLWSNLPPVPKPQAAPKPLPQPEEKPAPPPEPVKPPEPKPAPRPKVEEQPQLPKPDIKLKEKQQQEKLKQEQEKQKQQKLKEQEKLEQQKKAEEAKQAALKKEQEKQKQEEKLRKELLAQQQALEAAQMQQQQQQLAQMQRQAQQAAANAKVVASYTAQIRSKIRRFIILPPDIQGNPEAVFDVVLLPGGNVLSVKLVKSSGNQAYDDAVERAIYKAQPLPLPPDVALFSNFRELHLQFRPKDEN